MATLANFCARELVLAGRLRHKPLVLSMQNIYPESLLIQKRVNNIQKSILGAKYE